MIGAEAPFFFFGGGGPSGHSHMSADISCLYNCDDLFYANLTAIDTTYSPATFFLIHNPTPCPKCSLAGTYPRGAHFFLRGGAWWNLESDGERINCRESGVL